MILTSSPPPQKKNSRISSRGTPANFYSRLLCNFNKLLHCRRMHKFLCVACLALAMQHILKSCKNIENSYNNIPSGNLSVSKFCHRTVYWCSRIANFPGNGNAIISENYIAIVGEKLLRTVAGHRKPQKLEPVFDTQPQNLKN